MKCQMVPVGRSSHHVQLHATELLLASSRARETRTADICTWSTRFTGVKGHRYRYYYQLYTIIILIIVQNTQKGRSNCLHDICGQKTNTPQGVIKIKDIHPFEIHLRTSKTAAICEIFGFEKSSSLTPIQPPSIICPSWNIIGRSRNRTEMIQGPTTT